MTRMILFTAIAMFFFCVGITFAQGSWHVQPVQLQTRWAKEVSPENVLKEYPRPQMVRKDWTNLNGLWDYAVTAKDEAMPVKYDGKLLVPYAIESALSGVKKSLLPTQNLWYKRTIQKPELKNGEKTIATLRRGGLAGYGLC